jgi:hypothetical protein
MYSLRVIRPLCPCGHTSASFERRRHPRCQRAGRGWVKFERPRSASTTARSLATAFALVSTCCHPSSFARATAAFIASLCRHGAANFASRFDAKPSHEPLDQSSLLPGQVLGSFSCAPSEPFRARIARRRPIDVGHGHCDSRDIKARHPPSLPSLSQAMTLFFSSTIARIWHR